MSQALYESLVEKWKDFLDTHFEVYSGEMDKEAVDEYYDELVDKFCKQHGYSERTKNFAFYDRWWDTFADNYYQRLEKEGVEDDCPNCGAEVVMPSVESNFCHCRRCGTVAYRKR